ncbi:unnamed protein product [Citrullus colocynthis]|uniref:Uncharacterized protein n=1 Tax=Citrullus colocynthis TaxID=252529 RepID=A0ABP0Z238_9ROSI
MGCWHWECRVGLGSSGMCRTGCGGVGRLRQGWAGWVSRRRRQSFVLQLRPCSFHAANHFSMDPPISNRSRRTTNKSDLYSTVVIHSNSDSDSDNNPDDRNLHR